jgi:hypothetical protein
MATTAAERSVYPLSTRDADSIPLEVIDPTGLMFIQLASGAHTDFVIPDSYTIGFIWAELGCFLQMLGVPSGAFDIDEPSSGITATSKDNTLFVPPQTLLTIKWSPGAARLVSFQPAAAQRIIIQNTVKWNTLALAQQVTKK